MSDVPDEDFLDLHFEIRILNGRHDVLHIECRRGSICSFR